jgi:hypothetical protein
MKSESHLDFMFFSVVNAYRVQERHKTDISSLILPGKVCLISCVRREEEVLSHFLSGGNQHRAACVQSLSPL